MIQYIIGGVMVAAGVFVSLFIPWKIKNRIIEIKYLKTTPISELRGILNDSSAAGLGSYRHYVEINGSAGSDTPQKAPYSQRVVAYFDAKLYQVFEETETYRDSSGNTHTRMKKSETLLSEQKSSGLVTINEPQSGEKVYCDISQKGLRLETLKTLDKFEPSANLNQNSFFANFSFKPMGARTLGMRMVENTIPLGRALYAIGEAWLEGEKIIFGKPTESKNPFILSVRSESEILQSNKKGSTVALVLGIILAVAGLAVMIFVR